MNTISLPNAKGESMVVGFGNIRGSTRLLVETINQISE